MATRSVRPRTARRDPIELLDRMLNRTTITVQRFGHDTVQDVGEKAFNDAWERAWQAREDAIRQAIQETQERADQHLKESLEKAHREAEEEKRRALEEARLAAELKARLVAEERDRLEAERIAALIRKLTKEKEDALRKQWEECERIKEKAVADAIAETTRRLRNEFALAKELAIANALQHARAHFKKKLEETINETRNACARFAAEEATRVAKQHKAQVDQLNKEIEQMKQRVRDEIQARNFVQTDFRAVQRDYQRFLDYTDGRYHSDYLMRLRKHGMKFDKNWDRRDSADINIYPIPSALHRATVLGIVKPDDITQTISLAPIECNPVTGAR